MLTLVNVAPALAEGPREGGAGGCAVEGAVVIARFVGRVVEVHMYSIGARSAVYPSNVSACYHFRDSGRTQLERVRIGIECLSVAGRWLTSKTYARGMRLPGMSGDFPRFVSCFTVFPGQMRKLACDKSGIRHVGQ